MVFTCPRLPIGRRIRKYNCLGLGMLCARFPQNRISLCFPPCFRAPAHRNTKETLRTKKNTIVFLVVFLVGAKTGFVFRRDRFRVSAKPVSCFGEGNQQVLPTGRQEKPTRKTNRPTKHQQGKPTSQQAKTTGQQGQQEKPTSQHRKPSRQDANKKNQQANKMPTRKSNKPTRYQQENQRANKMPTREPNTPTRNRRGSVEKTNHQRIVPTSAHTPENAFLDNNDSLYRVYGTSGH